VDALLEEKTEVPLAGNELPPVDESETQKPNGAANGGSNCEAREFVSLKEAARQAVESAERVLIEEALQHTLWNRRKAAKLLSVSYSSLLRRIDAYEIGKS
jgi:DNA-binding NtrC family response regulator